MVHLVHACFSFKTQFRPEERPLSHFRKTEVSVEQGPRKNSSQRAQHNLRYATDTVLPAGLDFAELRSFREEKKGKSPPLAECISLSHFQGTAKGGYALDCSFLPVTLLFGADVKSCVLCCKRLMGVMMGRGPVPGGNCSEAPESRHSEALLLGE